MLAEATSTAMRTEVLAALKQASAATGSDFNYLLCTAMRESSLHPQAKSGTSSACGLFQFVEQTWFGLVKQYGAKYGLGSYANAIETNADGKLEVGDSEDRHAILALRNDPRISALMAGEYANATKSTLEKNLGRPVSNGELYAAHFLGPEAACRLIRLNGARPSAAAAGCFPQAAASNHRVFYHADGSAKSVREVYDWALNQPAVATGDAPSAAATKVAAWTPVEGQPSDDWSAVELLTALAPGAPSPAAGLGWSQPPFSASPAVLDLLGSLREEGEKK